MNGNFGRELGTFLVGDYDGFGDIVYNRSQIYLLSIAFWSTSRDCAVGWALIILDRGEKKDKEVEKSD